MLSARHKATPASKPPVIVFKVERQTVSRRKRATYNPERREEVKTVRKIRACLRCSLLKLKCSGNAICTTCRDLVLHAHERQVLSFSGCIRTRLVEVGFFEEYIPPPALRESILAKADDLDSTRISLEFASKVTWNLKFIIDDVVAWLYDRMDSDISKVGTLSSPKFLEHIETYTKNCERSDFQRMIYVLSLAYTQPTAKDKHHLSIPELRQIGAIAGQEVLKCLDNKLKPQSLKDRSYADIQGLFLLVFGTIIAVSYTVPSPTNPRLNEEVECTPEDVHQILARRHHLCQILAHYLVYLGSYLKLPMPSHTEQILLECAPARWYKRGKFQWVNSAEDESNNSEDEDCEDSRIKKDGFPPAFLAGPADNVLNPKDSADVGDSPSARRFGRSEQSDAWPELTFDRRDDSSISIAESRSLWFDKWDDFNCNAGTSLSQSLLSRQLLAFTRGPHEDQAVQWDFISQNEDSDMLMVPPDDHPSVSFQSPFGIASESARIDARGEADMSTEISQQLCSGIKGLTDQFRTSTQSVHFNDLPLGKRKRYKLSERERVTSLRRRFRCVSCNLPSSIGNLCYSCDMKPYRIPKLPKGINFQSPQQHFRDFCEQAGGSYCATYAQRIDAASQQTRVIGTTTEGTAEQERSCECVAINLLV